MAPVNIKYIVSFSSQDDSHKANNLVTSDGSKCWLSHKKDCSGKTELILQLEEPSQLAYLDIGAIWCATLEVRVGRSDWPQTMEFRPLLPTVMLMSPLDCHLSRSIKSTQMFTKKDFSQETACQLWDRLHIICRQPYRRDVQFGISFIHIRNVNSTPMPATVPVSNKDVTQIGKSVLDTSSIQKHFFGKTVKSGDESPRDMIKYRLMKMAGSTENGCDQEQGLSRTAKLVLMASENRPDIPRQISSPLSKRGLFPEHCARKNDIQIDVEMKSFLQTLKLSTADIDRVTIADLRHKFEKMKRRKLTKDEKRTFSELCQDFFFDLVEESNQSLETLRPDPVLRVDIQKDHLEASVYPNNMFNRPVTPRSASKNHETPQKTKISYFKQTGETHEFRSSNLSAKAGINCSSLSTSTKPDVYINMVDRIRQPGSDAPTSRKHLLNKPLSESEPGASFHEVTIKPSSSVMSSKSVIDEEIFNGTGKKQNVDRASKNSLPPVKQRSLFKTACSPPEKSFSGREEQTLTKDNDCHIGGGKEVTAADMMSSFSNGGDNVQHKGVKSKTFSYPNSPFHKMATEEDRSKPYQNSCSSKCPAEADVANSRTLPSGRPVKLKKLNKASFDLFHEFSLEIMNNDNSTEAVSKVDFSTHKGQLSQSDSKNGDNSLLVSSNLKDTKSYVSSTNDEIKKTSMLVNETITHKSKKGKIYRMNTSRHKLTSVGHTDCSPHSHSSVSDLQLTSEKLLIHNVDNNAKLENQDMNTSAPTLFDKPGRHHENKLVADFNQTISDFPSQRSRQKVKRRRTKSIPSTLSSEDASVCERCYGIYPPDSISAHQVFCVPPPSQNLRTAWTGQVDEMLIDDTVDYSECPICLQRFPQDVLPVHASECGI